MNSVDVIGGDSYLFPISYEQSPFPSLCATAFAELSRLMPERDSPRIPGQFGDPEIFRDLVREYGRLPVQATTKPAELVARMTRDLLAGAVNWRCPELQYNLGAATNVVATALYAIALDVNVYLINDGLAGNVVAAEAAVSRILASLTDIDPDIAYGLFTFGGTGTMAYGIKAGIRKASPESVLHGVPSDLRVVITEDAHFSHATAADWLGIGSAQLITVPADAERRSNLAIAEDLIRAQLEAGSRIATIIVNGGTTYDHAIDDIAAFASMRDTLVSEYDLPYRPHLHVDSVVGWAWLLFSESSLRTLPPGSSAATALREQHRRIQALRFADSWGVDFHKGAGGCPVDCSFVQFNDRRDFARLRKGGIDSTGLHQLAQEYSEVSPVDYTLETSRAGGKAMAALAALHSMGREGYGVVISRLVDAALVFRDEIAACEGMEVLNPHALGYQTMVRLYPPDVPRPSRERELTDSSPEAARLVRAGNAYLKAFFAWDNGTRMNVNGGGVVYSFSSSYIKTASGTAISGLKFYPTTPLIGRAQMRAASALLVDRKALFDSNWLQGDGRIS